jgi:hypothetical protein
MRSSTIGTIRKLVTALCCGYSTSLSAQKPVQWQVDDTIVDADRTAILTLARRIGIERPRKVSSLYPFLENCPVVLVESMVVEDGRRLSWEQGGGACARPELGPSRLGASCRQGGGATFGSLRLSPVMPEVDAASISSITRAGTAAQEYEVRTGVKAGL